ncbi:DNA replication complex GINS protein PSF2 [Cryptosporidium felis]|nr:DNA replication complex GINS protein PSF2 [Cryptosporidium felis]
MENSSYFLETRGDKGITFEESLFIAEEKVRVEIIPTISMDRKTVFSVEIGPFVPYQKCDVPLWVARYLDSKNLCRLVPPSWLTQEGLKRLLLEEEKAGPDSFCHVDFYYYQVANIYFELKNDPFNGKKNRVKSKFGGVFAGKGRWAFGAPPLAPAIRIAFHSQRAFPGPVEQKASQAKGELQALNSPEGAGHLQPGTNRVELRVQRLLPLAFRPPESLDPHPASRLLHPRAVSRSVSEGPEWRLPPRRSKWGTKR